MKRKIVLVILIFVVLGGASWYVMNRLNGSVAEVGEQTQTITQNTDTEPETEEFDKTQHSIDEPGSPWWIVNKNRALPDGYAPADLVVPNVRLRLARDVEQMQFSAAAAPALEAMFAAAQKDGVTLVFGSGYRSYALQKQFYDSYVARDGQAAADRYSARPGTSEHQTGLSFDATAANGRCHLQICFEDTPEGRWLSEHAHEHGFIIRYPSGKEAVTGYQYEPWHLRYVGPELAAELRRTGQTMEEFFSLN